MTVSVSMSRGYLRLGRDGRGEDSRGESISSIPAPRLFLGNPSFLSPSFVPATPEWYMCVCLFFSDLHVYYLCVFA